MTAFRFGRHWLRYVDPEICAVCGKTAIYRVPVPGTAACIGCCREHKDEASRLTVARNSHYGSLEAARKILYTNGRQPGTTSRSRRNLT